MLNPHNEPLFSSYEPDTLVGRFGHLCWQTKESIVEYFSPPETPLYFNVLKNPEFVEYCAWRAQIDLENEFVERVFCQDLIWQVIQFGANMIEEEAVENIFSAYQNKVDESFFNKIKNLISKFQDDANSYFENHADKETGTLFVTLPNKMVRGVIDEINASFDKYERALPVEEVKKNEVEETTVYQVAKEGLQSGYNFLKKHPGKTFAAIATTAAIIYAGKRSDSINFNSLTALRFPQWATPSWQMTNALTQATVAYGLSMASVGREYAVPSAFLAGFTSLLGEVGAAAPTIINPIPDQIVEVGIPFNLTFRWDHVFYDADNDTLSITAEMSDGGSLPVWLQLGVDPFRLGFYDTPDRAVVGIVVKDSTAYVADGFSGVQIIDVGNASAPIPLGFYDTPNYAEGVALIERTVYVADRSAFQIIDVSNSSAPYRLGFCDTLGTARGIVVIGSTAYLANGGSGLQIIGMVNLSAPIRLGFYDTPGEAWGVVVMDSTAYVADGYFGLQIINVSNTSAPYRLGFYNTTGRAYGIYVAGGKAYVTVQNGIEFVAQTPEKIP